MQDLIRSRRWQTLSRDHTYQQSEDAALVRQQNHNKGLRSRRIQLTNKGGTDYNILNFQYEKTAGGHALQTRVRARMVERHSLPEDCTSCCADVILPMCLKRWRLSEV